MLFLPWTTLLIRRRRTATVAGTTAPPNVTSRRFGKGKPRPRAPGLCCDAGCSDQVEATDGCAATRSNKVSMILLTKRCSVLLSL
jgi:hypothetical protein